MALLFFNLELEVSKTRRQKVCVMLILVTQVTKYLSYLKVYSMFGKLRQEHILSYMYHQAIFNTVKNMKFRFAFTSSHSIKMQPRNRFTCKMCTDFVSTYCFTEWMLLWKKIGYLLLRKKELRKRKRRGLF